MRGVVKSWTSISMGGETMARFSAVAFAVTFCAAAVAQAQTVGNCSPPNDVSRRWGTPKQVLFDTGSVKLNADGQKAIAEQAKLAKANFIQQICLTGYTDKQGSVDNNQKLARARAQAVAADLVKNGIDAKSIVITPVSKENTGTTLFGMGAQSQNERRVDIRFGR